MDLGVCRACGWTDGRDGTFPQDDITEREQQPERLAALLPPTGLLPVSLLAPPALPPPINEPLIAAAVLQGKLASFNP